MKRLVDFPSPRVCPPEILRALREVDPTAELVYTGFGSYTDPDSGEELYGPRWVLGAVNPSREGRLKALDALKKTLARFELETAIARAQGIGAHLEGIAARDLIAAIGNLEAGLRMNRLFLQGFAPIQTYLVRDPDSSIVHDFREADWLYRNRREEAFEETADRLEGGHLLRRKLARIRDSVDSQALDAHRHTTTNRLVTSGSGTWSQHKRTRPRGASLYH